MAKINKDEFISILQKRGWYSFEDSGIDFKSALPRGIQSIIEGMLVTGIYKMKGTIVFKDGCYPDVPILVGDSCDAKQEENKDGAVDMDCDTILKENEELKKQLAEAKSTISKQYRQSEEDDKEFLMLQKEYKEYKTQVEQSAGNVSDIDNYQTVAMKDGELRKV